LFTMSPAVALAAPEGSRGPGGASPGAGSSAVTQQTQQTQSSQRVITGNSSSLSPSRINPRTTVRLTVDTNYDPEAEVASVALERVPGITVNDEPGYRQAEGMTVDSAREMGTEPP